MTAPQDRPIAFIDLAAQQARLRPKIDAAIARVLDHGQYIMGPEIGALERALAGFCGARHAIVCASGTDALALGLMAKGVRPGDAVLVPGFTFAASAEVVAWLGASPVFVDVLPDTFNLDPAALPAGLAAARRAGLQPRAVIAVDLFGQPADYDRIEAFCRAENLWLLADAAQSFGAAWRGRRAGAIGEIAAASFFPAKPLGCYGDGGAVFTGDDGIAEIITSLRIHGQGVDKYDNVRIGMNGRMDTLQAAILLEKLAIFFGEIEARERVAARYSAALSDVVEVPRVIDGASSVWAQYTIRLPGRDRDAVAARLKDAGIPTAVHYRRALHRQPAYARYPTADGGLPVAERLSSEVLCLPMHPYLDQTIQDRIVAAVRASAA